jgi:hypothetical protein
MGPPDATDIRVSRSAAEGGAGTPAVSCRLYVPVDWCITHAMWAGALPLPSEGAAQVCLLHKGGGQAGRRPRRRAEGQRHVCGRPPSPVPTFLHCQRVGIAAAYQDKPCAAPHPWQAGVGALPSQDSARQVGGGGVKRRGDTKSLRGAPAGRAAAARSVQRRPSQQAAAAAAAPSRRGVAPRQGRHEAEKLPVQPLLLLPPPSCCSCCGGRCSLRRQRQGSGAARPSVET